MLQKQLRKFLFEKFKKIYIIQPFIALLPQKPLSLDVTAILIGKETTKGKDTLVNRMYNTTFGANENSALCPADIVIRDYIAYRLHSRIGDRNYEVAVFMTRIPALTSAYSL